MKHDATKTIESKTERELRKRKTSLSTRLSPGKFHGIAKLCQFATNGTIDDLPIRPIASNMDTASYHLEKCFA